MDLIFGSYIYSPLAVIMRKMTGITTRKGTAGIINQIVVRTNQSRIVVCGDAQEAETEEEMWCTRRDRDILSRHVD